ncbi:MAG TPA: hypothetical protein VHM30_16775, partial [Gemmatimonadaceae bacterium]|nr:hypothetical protein [Gemmatimonadaceae bacterium]
MAQPTRAGYFATGSKATSGPKASRVTGSFVSSFSSAAAVRATAPSVAPRARSLIMDADACEIEQPRPVNFT